MVALSQASAMARRSATRSGARRPTTGSSQLKTLNMTADARLLCNWMPWPAR